MQQMNGKKAITEAMVRASAEEAKRLIAEESECRDFILWIDGQFDKIQMFYRKKEVEAISRFDKMRVQLHLLRDRKMVERKKAAQELVDAAAAVSDNDARQPNGNNSKNAKKKSGERWSVFYKKLDLHHLPFMPAKSVQVVDGNGQQDYIRQQAMNVPYSVARRKLKLVCLYVSFSLIFSTFSLCAN